MMIRLILLATLWMVSAAWAEIYRWTDAQGRVHFGDRPRGEEAQRLQIETPLAAPSPDLPSDAQRHAEQQRLIDALREDRQAREAERRKAAQEEAQRSQRCAYARNRLKRYRGGRLYQPQEDGGRRYLDDTERRREIARAEDEVERWCDR